MSARRRPSSLSLGGARAAALALAAVAVGAGGIALADSADGPQDYVAASGLGVTSVHPTGVGLPQLGASGTVGAGQLTSALQAYHDSGRYAEDLQAVGGAAQAYLDQRLAAPAARPRTCVNRYRRAHVAHSTLRYYRATRICHRVGVATTRPAKPAIVLDIDETSLSNYAGLSASGFSSVGTVPDAVAGTGTAIAPTLALYRDARAHGVAVFFVTGRPAAIDGQTQANLKAVGYDQGWDAISEKPGDMTTEQFKAGRRAAIEAQGYDIVANVGDQESDLDGGHADRAFKLPNPFYFISD